MTLTEFILQRIAEDEAAAREIPAGSWEDACSTTRRYDHVFRWSPDRVLAECEAKRQIVGLHTPDHECTDGSDSYPGVMGAGMYEPYCPTLRALALPFADHPDYREEWKP